METKNKFLKWALIAGIVIVLNLFLNYAISLVYKAPDWNSYFAQTQVVESYTTQETCLKVGGQWTENNTVYNDKTAPAPVDNNGNKITGYCNPDFTRQQDYADAQKIYNRNIFIVLSVLGVLALVFGTFSPNIILSLGFSWAGVLSLIIASGRYWTDADNIVKVLILAVALGALIWLAIRKFSSENKQ